MLAGLLLVAGVYGVLTYEAYKDSLKSVREVVYQRAGKKNRIRVHDYIFQIEDIIRFKVRREMINSGRVTPEHLDTIVDQAISLSAGIESAQAFSCTDELATRVSGEVMEAYENDF